MDGRDTDPGPAQGPLLHKWNCLHPPHLASRRMPRLQGTREKRRSVTASPGIPRGRESCDRQAFKAKANHTAEGNSSHCVGDTDQRTLRNARKNAALLMPLGVSTAALYMSRAKPSGESGGRTWSVQHQKYATTVRMSRSFTCLINQQGS